ncbi:hypothetical protein Pcinc_040007, partial [Petrolisthes cinctipes]
DDDNDDDYDINNNDNEDDNDNTDDNHEDDNDVSERSNDQMYMHEANTEHDQPKQSRLCVLIWDETRAACAVS